MTTSEIKTMLVAVDSTVERYESSRTGSEAYTVWRELGPGAFFADGKHQDVTRFQIDRFTKTEDDTVAAAIFTALEARDDVAFEYLVDHETDTGYIHHIYDCEGC